MIRILTALWHGIKRHKKKSIAGVMGLVLLGLLIWGVTRPAAPEYVTAVARRGDLRQIVEAVGTVVSERELELRFAATGIVSNVAVKEGDRVRAGQRLAQLKSSGLAASIASQQAALESALADLRTLEQGTRPEDIAIAEADLLSKRASLNAAKQTLASAEENLATSQQKLMILRQEASVNLAGQVTTSLNTASEELTDAENALSTVDDVLNRTDVNDAIAKSRPGAGGEILSAKRAAQEAIAAARRSVISATSDYKAAEQALTTSRSAASASAGALNLLFSLVSSLQETSSFTASARETVKASVATERSKAQDSVGAIASALSTLQNASATYDTKIAAEQSNVVSYQGTRDKAQIDILTYESAVRSAEAQLSLKRAGARPTDIDAARARVRQQQALVARSQADYADTILTAPVAGIVTHVNVRIGESLPAGAAVTLLGESPYRVEMFVSEVDIPRVQLTQTGSIELDAFRGAPIVLRVGDIDPSATDRDGVPKYRVRLDFAHPHTDLKIGMTGDAEIVTGMRSNVVSVPRRAALASASGSTIVRVLLEDGETIEERPVTIGMEGEGGEVEVEGVEEGEVVVVLIKE